MIHNLDRRAMGERIRKKREELNISREQFAEMLDITTKFCSDIESGSRGVSIKSLIAISDCLKLSTDYILFGDVSQTSNQVFIQSINKCPDSKKNFLLDIINKIIDSYIESGQ